MQALRGAGLDFSVAIRRSSASTADCAFAFSRLNGLRPKGESGTLAWRLIFSSMPTR